MEYIEFDQVIRINEHILTGSPSGLLNSGNLRYCLDSVMSIQGEGDREKVLAAKAGMLIFCIVRNHPFLDGNKRTAFQAAYIFLLSNGFVLERVDSKEAVALLVGVAKGGVSTLDVVSWVRKHLKPTG